AVNFIFLLENEDQKGGLKDELREGTWQALWAALPSIPIEPLDDSLVLACYQWAGQASALSFTRFVEVLDRDPLKSPLLNRVLIGYTASKELWTNNDNNEATHIKNSLAPCLDALFPRIDNAEASWERSLDESKDADQRLLVPDYSVATTVRDKTYTALMLEAKIAKNNSHNQIWDDLTKLGHEMKLALDSILLVLPVEEIVVQGIILKGETLSVYHLRLISEGVYIMRLHAQCGICSSSTGLYPLARMLDVLTSVKDIAANTIKRIRNAAIDAPDEPLVSPGEPLIPRTWLRPSFEKPSIVKVLI
ncbi:hypothetical protein BGZ65_007355, partial [Modicella reniformis]